jgi:hypothetical protein
MNSQTAAVLERFAERTRAEQEAEERKDREVAERLNLPPLLEQRRRAFKIPEAAFLQTAMFDHILVWQVADFGDTYGEGGLIIKPDNVKSHEQEEAPRGVLITAGLHALDTLWGHGLEVGSLVNFAAVAPFRLYLDDTYKVSLVVLRDGDLLASEDVRKLLRDGVLQVRHELVDDGKGGRKRQHVYFDTRTNSIRVPWAPTTDSEV